MTGHERERREALAPIVGEELSSVEFIRDYVSLHFDGPRLDALNDPLVIVEKRVFTASEPGWRDALCERISATVVTASVGEAEITIMFDDLAEVHIPFALQEDSNQAEAAIFNNGFDDFWVFATKTSAGTEDT